MNKIDQLLANDLRDGNKVAENILLEVIKETEASHKSLMEVLQSKSVFKEDEILKMYSEILRIPFAEDLSGVNPEPSVVQKIPLKIAEYYRIIPIKMIKRKLIIASHHPLESKVLDDMRAQLGQEIEPILARRKDIDEALHRIYGFAAGVIGEMVESSKKERAESREPEIKLSEGLEGNADDSAIGKLVNAIIIEAYNQRATDIHIEPYRGKLKLRYRIDGVLFNANVHAEINNFLPRILSRIKIICSLNIVEKRIPQDGRAIIKMENTHLDLRVSFIPTPYGESVVMRLLPMNRVFKTADLGLDLNQQKTFDTLINKPYGIIFISGPTGCGKTTTLYACLNQINSEDRKIITIEDPIEYEMEGVTQIQVSSAVNLSFAIGLRSILRHDPDVIMVGEVRDLETAETAIRVALTGHLVFSTLHTNDAASGVTRLIDIGVPPYLVASSVEAFVAQRLVRKICTSCNENDREMLPEIKKRIARELGISYDDVKVSHGKGCHDCHFTGFLGRLAIYEILVIDDAIRKLITQKAVSSELKREAVLRGMRSLRQDGWRKVIDGLTTPGEIFEATPDDDTLVESNTRPLFQKALKDSLKANQRGSASRFDDKRVFVRLDTTVNVLYEVLHGAEISQTPQMRQSTQISEEHTQTKNISAGGLLFSASKSIGSGSILRLKIELPESEQVIECLARVVREVEVEPSKVFDVSVQFLDLSGGDRGILEQFVEKESS